MDAGAKIYAGRVDAVHQETYQVLSGLGRTNKDGSNENDEKNENYGQQTNDLNDDEDESNQLKAAHRKKFATHREVIQKHLAKIRCKALVAKADVGFFFLKKCLQFRVFLNIFV